VAGKEARMSLGAPEWLFLLPALAVLGWRARGLRLHEPLRALALLAVVIALAEPRARVGGGGLDLWVLVDRSDSAAAAAVKHAGEAAAIIERARKSGDRVFYIDYAGLATRREQGDPVFRDTSHRTRTGAALEFALAQLEPDRTARLLVLTDGYATEPLGTSAEQVLRRRVPLDYRWLGEETGNDVRVGAVEAPMRVLPGEAFLVEFALAGRGDADVPWEVVRDGKVAASGTAVMRGGRARVRLTDRLGGTGMARYEVHLKPAADTHPENNRAGSWVEVAGGPRVLLISNYPDDPLAPLLEAQGLTVERVAEPGKLTPAELAGTRLVVINNVPAHRVASEFLGALDYFIREQGGGLLMAGGTNSFGAGGYFSSALDPLLPVSMELRKEHRKLAVAMSIILDRSGSMAADAGGGLRKMDLANAGAARAIELLGDMDAVAVHAVDSSPHIVVELAAVGPNRQDMLESVRRIESSGGGIFTYTGMKAGWEELQKAQTGQRHMIVFADAADAEEPGEYISLLAEMTAAGVTVSVIGMGSDTDSDAEFLKDVAKHGNGRIFFNTDPNELPALFAQETVSVARSAFINEPTAAAGTPGWTEIAARAPDWLKQVDGYNLSYLRSGATASLVTTDEYEAPLVAAWARGAGRVAAVSFPLGGEHSELIRAWPGYGDFAQTLSRWLAGEDVPPGLALRTSIQGEQLSLDLLYDESWAARIAQAGPVASLAGTGNDQQAQPLIWEKLAPGHFRATAALEPGRMVRGAVRLGGAALPFGPATSPGLAEWSFDQDRRTELAQLAERSGGRERLDLAAVWDAPREVHVRSLRVWVLALGLLLLVADAALTRLGISLVPRSRA
jgi:hypothetical protein